MCPVGGVSREHPVVDSGPHEAFCLLRCAGIHDVDGLVGKKVLGVFLEFLGQDPDRLVMSVDVAGFHLLVLTSTEGVGAPINAWAA